MSFNSYWRSKESRDSDVNYLFSRDTALLLSLEDIRTLERASLTFGEFKQLVRESEGKNGKSYVVVADRYTSTARYFAFSIYSEFNLWDGGGSTSLGEYKFESDNEELSDKFCKWLEETIDDYINGVIRCSCCGKKLTKEEVAGHYFAGSYCEECWEGKYKAIEAAETYN